MFVFCNQKDRVVDFDGNLLGFHFKLFVFCNQKDRGVDFDRNMHKMFLIETIPKKDSWTFDLEKTITKYLGDFCKLKSIFDHWIKFYLAFNAQPKIKNWIDSNVYCTTLVLYIGTN